MDTEKQYAKIYNERVDNMSLVALVKMPWGFVQMGSIALGILKSALVREEIPTDVYYLNVRMAKNIPMEIYSGLFVFPQLGEWLFSHYLFGEFGTNELKKGYKEAMEDLIPKLNSGEQEFMGAIKDNAYNLIQNVISRFMDECLSDIPWGDYRLVGFTCTAGEYLPSILLAKKIKEKFPQVKIVLGGPNVFGGIGSQTLRDFEWIDYVIDGEGEKSLTALAKNVLEGDFYTQIPGVSFRREGEVFINQEPHQMVKLDENPVPDYTDYYEEVKRCGLEGMLGGVIPFESSRGCWWGEKVHCAFCGVNNYLIKFRSKSAGKVIEELEEQSAKYGTKEFFATDSILDTSYFNDLIPELIGRNLDLNIYYQVKSDLSRKQLEALLKAGIRSIQPGIESLHTGLLKLMRKGVTAIQNIQLLKLSAELGISVNWLILYKVPGESKSSYTEMIGTMLAVSHLQPPFLTQTIDLDRYSPYYSEPEKYGIKDVRPRPIYYYLYPEEKVNIDNIAYTFEFACDSLEGGQDDYTDVLRQAISEWQEAFQDKKVFCKYAKTDGSIEITDNRPLTLGGSTDTVRQFTYSGAESCIYTFCGTIRPFGEIYEYINSDAGFKLDQEQLKAILDEFVGHRLMYMENGKYLSLACLQE